MPKVQFEETNYILRNELSELYTDF